MTLSKRSIAHVFSETYHPPSTADIQTVSLTMRRGDGAKSRSDPSRPQMDLRMQATESQAAPTALPIAVARRCALSDLEQAANNHPVALITASYFDLGDQQTAFVKTGRAAYLTAPTITFPVQRPRRNMSRHNRKASPAAPAGTILP